MVQSYSESLQLPAAVVISAGVQLLTGAIQGPQIHRSGRQSLSCIWCRLMTRNNPAVVMRGLALPVVMGWQLGVYCDRCLAGFGPMGVWRDSWEAGQVRTLGLDLMGVRVRLVLEREEARKE